ncbi:UDP-N-acetylmuramate:L-alanyl-gamma-D-glutamyl-meso-diaminopimelate ligase [Verrucomicrobia bacterium LW23]|nr:UDP-N-acetylmuramate:L-alanyl-gamma-D-glutamyl-meso-diaminopimelate ligase [Verrucomicrobia bacterium LW23]PTY04521.1 UDP-N-acetylmuramate:L-alanyl-gamma-D-glutamyl-meso-diaminopimelate ligase [Verrucomicrobia bacterium LW23]
MQNISTSSRVSFHFMGICGTAMGAVAAMLHDSGHTVTGSDENVYPPMSTFLESKGIRIMAGYSPGNLPKDENAVLVVGNTIKRGNVELEAALDARRFCTCLPEVLKHHFLRYTHNLVVTGTHGKTTTTSLLAWIFQHAGKEPSWLIGGIPYNLDQGCKRQGGRHWILEGDEYDTAFFDKRSKFVHYLPELLIINNIEFDHADIFEDLTAIQKSFRNVVRIVPRNGTILVNADDPNAIAVTTDSPAPVLEVGFSPNAAIRIENLREGDESQTFTLLGTEFRLPMSGAFNARNAAMAIAAAHFYQLPLPVIAEALAQFKGVKRRQEVRGEKNGVTVIDDFGHHPTALRETIRGLRSKYPRRRLWAVFEPRSNTTRRAVFQSTLPEALSHADGVYVAQVAKLEQIPAEQRLNPEKVVADINAAGVPAYYEANADAIVASLSTKVLRGDVVAVFSNGGFGGIHEKLLTSLSVLDGAAVAS